MCAIMCTSIQCHVQYDGVFLECSAISLDSANYTINWYYEGEVTTNLTIARFASIIQGPDQQTYFQISRLGLERLNISGHYYCQIQLTDNSTDIEFEPSKP